MQGCFPFRMCLECVQGPSFSVTQSYAHLRDELHCVKLDATCLGSEVVLLKNGSRICGTGGALSTAPIVQNKAYFQVSIQQSGVWGIGLGTRVACLSSVPVVSNAWVLRNDGQLFADGEVIGRIEESIQENDKVGVAFDHVELKFFKDGQPLSLTIPNIKASTPLYPLVYVDESAILDVAFRSNDMHVPDGYEEIMIEQTLL